MAAVGGWRWWVTMREAAADATRRAVARARCYRPHQQMPLPDPDSPKMPLAAPADAAADVVHVGERPAGCGMGGCVWRNA
jgi:hypothetical protein